MTLLSKFPLLTNPHTNKQTNKQTHTLSSLLRPALPLRARTAWPSSAHAHTHAHGFALSSLPAWPAPRPQAAAGAEPLPRRLDPTSTSLLSANSADLYGFFARQLFLLSPDFLDFSLKRREFQGDKGSQKLPSSTACYCLASSSPTHHVPANAHLLGRAAPLPQLADRKTYHLPHQNQLPTAISSSAP